MSDRPTPETDAARHDLSDYGPPVLCSWGDWVPFEVAEQLERERDEAREKYDQICSQTFIEINKVCDERDELREANKFLTVFLAHIRDNADIRYGKHRGLFAFGDLKQEASRKWKEAAK